MMETSGLAPIFHERSRLSMMTVLAANPRGVAFTELRDLCKLTDGNLSRHLHKLAEAGLVVMEKKFVKGMPNTTIRVTQEGIEQFSQYVEELEQVVAAANRAVRSTSGRAAAESPDDRTESGGMGSDRVPSAKVDNPMQELRECR